MMSQEEQGRASQEKPGAMKSQGMWGGQSPEVTSVAVSWVLLSPPGPLSPPPSPPLFFLILLLHLILLILAVVPPGFSLAPCVF